MLSCLFVSIFMQTDRAGLPGTPNIDHALIGAAAPAELCILLRFDERPVHDNIYGIKERQICDLLQMVFSGKRAWTSRASAPTCSRFAG